MRPDGYLWIALSAVFAALGTYVLIDADRRPGPYTEAYILFGGTLAALGLAAMFFALKHRAEIRALAQHFGHGSHAPRNQRRKE